MCKIYTNNYVRNAQGYYVYLNTDDGSIAFEGQEFKEADFFSCGLAYVTGGTSDKPICGFIDKDNRLVIDGYGKWQRISGFSDGLAIGQTRESEYVVIDTEGNSVYTLPSNEWEPQTLYKDGYSIWAGPDCWAAIDTKGNIRKFDQYGFGHMYPAWGLICIWTEDEKGNTPRYGAMDIEDGKMVIPCKYVSAFMFDRNGYAVVKDPETNKYGLIDRKGKYTIAAQYESIETDGPDLYKCRNYNSYAKEDFVEWKNHKAKTICYGGGSDLNRSAYFFANRESFVKAEYDKEQQGFYYCKFSKEDGQFTEIRQNDVYKKVVVYPPAFKNGNSIANYRPRQYDHRTLLVNRNFEPIGENEFHEDDQAVFLQSNAMLRLQRYYTHGIPYVQKVWYWMP